MADSSDKDYSFLRYEIADPWKDVLQYWRQIYNFPTSDETVAEVNRSMNEHLPFAVVGSSEFVKGPISYTFESLLTLRQRKLECLSLPMRLHKFTRQA